MDSQNLTTCGRHITAFMGRERASLKDARNRSGIYGIYSKTERRLYVGSAVNMSGRWSAHKSTLRDGKHHAKSLQTAWDAHGADDFEFWVFIFCDPCDLKEREQWYVDRMLPNYNSTWIVTRLPEGVRDKMAGRNSGEKNPFYGKKHTEETKLKMRSNRADMSGENNPMFGVRLTGERNPSWGKKKPEISAFNTRTKKGRTYEEMYGPERAVDLRRRIIESNKARRKKND